MFLKYLEIQGFKSFPDKVNVPTLSSLINATVPYASGANILAKIIDTETLLIQNYGFKESNVCTHRSGCGSGRYFGLYLVVEVISCE